MAKPSPVIADHPPAEMYQPGLAIECQCARCGSSCAWDGCDECAEDGYDIDDEGVIVETCAWCHGYGGWHNCVSSAEWCNAHPLPGRESVQRGKIEWFVIEEQANG